MLWLKIEVGDPPTLPLKKASSLKGSKYLYKGKIKDSGALYGYSLATMNMD